MSEKAGFDQPPQYNPTGGAYPPSGGGYPPAGAAYVVQPEYGQAYSQQTTQAVIVNQPGAEGHVIVQPRPPDYMMASTFACLFCFWPTGLCAIHYASQARKLASIGDMEGATRMSNNARNLMIASIVIEIILTALVIVAYILFVHDQKM